MIEGNRLTTPANQSSVALGTVSVNSLERDLDKMGKTQPTDAFNLSKFTVAELVHNHSQVKTEGKKVLVFNPRQNSIDSSRQTTSMKLISGSKQINQEQQMTSLSSSRRFRNPSETALNNRRPDEKPFQNNIDKPELKSIHRHTPD